MSPTPTTIEEISNLEIRTNRHSRLFLFRDYAFLTRGIVENEQQSFTVKLLRFNPHPPSLIATLLQESLWRIAKGIAALALTILTLPVWIPILTIAYLNNPLDTSTAIFNGWTRGRELALEEAAII